MQPSCSCNSFINSKSDLLKVNSGICCSIALAAIIQSATYTRLFMAYRFVSEIALPITASLIFAV